MKLSLLFLIIIPGFIWPSCQSARQAPLPQEENTEEAEEFSFVLPPQGDNLPVSVFPEVWVYVVAGNNRELFLNDNLPITDVGYFGAEVDLYGTLVNVPNRRNLPPFSGRVHLVVSCNGRALSYFALLPGSPQRRALIADLLAAARNFDGLQINFENIPQRAGESYFTFLSELRAGLPADKMFTVALAARTRQINNDVYDYARIAPVVDRILVMAYDEHWSTSAPGPIASLDWSRNVAAHSIAVIGQEKLIMGLPFYGRGWSSPSHHQAYVYTGIERIIRENNVTEIRRENGIPTFNYEATVSVRVFYEDEYSLSTRMEMYRSMGVNKVGFWRLGQETVAVWNYIKLEE